MLDEAAQHFIFRDLRLPLFVQVITRPALREAWSVNLSRSGIGLEFASRPSAIAQGDEIEMEFGLPDSGSTIHARGEVAWLHESGIDGGGAIGVRFVDMPGGDRRELATFISGSRFRVLVCCPSARDRSVVEGILSETAQLFYADSLAELEEVLEHGDISTALVCAGDEEIGVRMVERVRSLRQADPFGTQAGADLLPRVIYCGPASPTALLRLFDERRIFRVVPVPVQHGPLSTAVSDAFRDYGMRKEQRRTTLALQRALYREQASRAPAERVRSAVSTEAILNSPSMQGVLALARRAAPHKVSVLVQGETGAGKGVLARLIHRLSDRANEAFVVQDCGALSETLLESELFGHVKGSFTSAIANHPGLFAIAEGGTVFLDEIENTSPNMQAKLLRALETGEVRPVGGTQVRHVDVRVIAASNRDLADEVAAGRFRADLFYRLNTFPIQVPALRERPDDVLPLAEHFLGQVSAGLGGAPLHLTGDAAQLLVRYSWPGNIRELRNVIERAVLLADPGQPIDASHLPAPVRTAPRDRASSPIRRQIESLEGDLIREALLRHGGVARRAARDLGVSPATLSRRMRQLGLRKSSAGRRQP